MHIYLHLSAQRCQLLEVNIWKFKIQWIRGVKLGGQKEGTVLK